MSKAMKELLLRSGLMNTEEVANALGVSARTIIRWRCDRINIPFNYIGGQARYEPSDVLAFKNSTRIDVGLPPASHQHSDAA